MKNDLRMGSKNMKNPENPEKLPPKIDAEKRGEKIQKGPGAEQSRKWLRQPNYQRRINPNNKKPNNFHRILR